MLWPKKDRGGASQRSTPAAGALLEKCGQPSQVRNLLDQYGGWAASIGIDVAVQDSRTKTERRLIFFFRLL
jgi:hypothetical protein